MTVEPGVRQATKISVLLVEDETIIALAQSRILKKNGFEVLVAASGRKAVDMAKRHTEIGLVLMDINLGRGIDGTEAAREILADQDIPIIFLSSHIEQEYVEKTEAISSYGYVVKNAGETVLIASIKMALRLSEAKRQIEVHEKLLEESDRRFHGAMDELLEGCQIIDFDYRYVYVNHAAARQGKSVPEKLVGKSMLELYPGIENMGLFAAIMSVMEGRQPIKTENLFPFADGSSGWFELSIQPVPEGVIILSIETTERKKAETALRDHVHELETAREHESLLAAIVENARMPIGVTYTDGSIGEVNQAFCELLGYTREEFRFVRWMDDITPSEWRNCEESEARKLWDGADSVRYEKEVMRKDGSRVSVRLLAQAVRDEAGRPLYYYSFVEDLRAQKKREAERTALLRDREMLLQELQHRVKNSLNTIGAILYLKESETESEDVREAMRSVRERIDALALLYRQLDATDSADISLDEYLRAMIDSLRYGYQAAQRGILVTADLEPIRIDLKRGANFGLIANELLINALKHAFPPERLAVRGGTVELALRRNDGHIALDVRDDGIGFEGSFPKEEAKGLGLNLAYQLTEQIPGMIRKEQGEAGTVFRLTAKF